MAVLKRIGPATLSTTLTTNIYNPPGPEVVRNVHVVNHTDSPATFSIWIGLTGANTAGTELFSKQTVPARGVLDWPFPLKLGTADFVVGGVDAVAFANALTMALTTEQAAV